MARPPSANSIIRNLKKEKRSFEPKTPIASEMYLPNQSGDHSSGIVLTTPTIDSDIANKKYVDDETFRKWGKKKFKEKGDFLNKQKEVKK